MAQADIDHINQMTREEMCQLWRYAPAGHPYFITGTPEYEAFKKRFDMLGRFSPEISKKIDRAAFAEEG